MSTSNSFNGGDFNNDARPYRDEESYTIYFAPGTGEMQQFREEAKIAGIMPHDCDEESFQLFARGWEGSREFHTALLRNRNEDVLFSATLFAFAGGLVLGALVMYSCFLLLR